MLLHKSFFSECVDIPHTQETDRQTQISQKKKKKKKEKKVKSQRKSQRKKKGEGRGLYNNNQIIIIAPCPQKKTQFFKQRGEI